MDSGVAGRACVVAGVVGGLTAGVGSMWAGRGMGAGTVAVAVAGGGCWLELEALLGWGCVGVMLAGRPCRSVRKG